MLRQSRFLGLLVVFFGLVITVMISSVLVSCGDPKAPAAPTGTSPKAAAEGARGFSAGTSPADSAEDAAELSTVARRLAGLDTESNTPVWSRHGERMERLWNEIEQRHLKGIRDWSDGTLASLVPEPDLPLFYPFGGPDFLSSFLFFPESPVHVLVGLQPPGNLPRLGTQTEPNLETELTRLRSGFESLMEAGYFQQIDMDADFAAERLDGVLPVLYIFLARTGHRPIAVKHRALNSDGELIDPGPGEEAHAVEIQFVQDDGQQDSPERPRTLVYFAQDLSDDGLAANPGFTQYLERLDRWNVFMKAAVYLLHMEGFTSLRDLLLERTQTLLQTDSGLIHHDLKAEDWNLTYFGRYTQTLPVYRQWYQEDLKDAFEEHTSGALEFAIGYHSVIGEGCLILANRRHMP